jgi:hypothetical protein
LLSVVFQNRIADFDAFVADIHAHGTLSRVCDERVHVVLGLTAKRASEDLIVALEKHKLSMASAQRKSRFPNVQIGDVH